VFFPELLGLGTRTCISRCLKHSAINSICGIWAINIVEDSTSCKQQSNWFIQTIIQHCVEYYYWMWWPGDWDWHYSCAIFVKIDQNPDLFIFDQNCTILNKICVGSGRYLALTFYSILFYGLNKTFMLYFGAGTIFKNICCSYPGNWVNVTMC